MRKSRYTPKWKSGSKIKKPLSDNPHAVHSRRWRQQNPEANKLYQRIWAKNKRDKLRAKVLEVLGNKCSNPNCLVPNGCRDVRCLQIDHINGNGTQERRQTTCSYVYYSRIIESIQKGERKYQLLCANCNWIKRVERQELNSHEHTVDCENVSSMVS